MKRKIKIRTKKSISILFKNLTDSKNLNLKKFILFYLNKIKSLGCHIKLNS